jgi:SNF2 Helicase protein
MIILHASASDGRLLLWGETTPREPAPSPPRSARPARSRFAIEAYRLVDAVSAEIPGSGLSRAKRQSAIAWLPSNDEGALPSSPLLTGQPADPGATRIAPWEVPALALTTEQAIEILAACKGRPTLGPGVVVGKTLAYWAAVLRFAGALVARQHYLPGLVAEADGTTFRARWEPVLAGESRLEGERLARSMPHAGRALDQDAEKPPDSPAATVLAEVLGQLVDHLVRAAADPLWKGTGRFPSVHDQWAHALRSSDGRMHGETAALAQLTDQVKTWRRPIDIATSAPFRLCFRLEEPRSDAGKAADCWRINYLLQAVDDLSLLVPAEDAWKARGKEAAVLARDGFRPREYLLAALGQAATLSPPIEASLKAAAPAGYDLETPGAHEFLSLHAGPLEQAGFGVFLPSWWTRKGGTRLRLSARAVVAAPKMTSKAGLSLDAILNFHWQIALGDQTLTLEELRALAKLKTPLVKVRGQWVEISPEEIRAALSYWEQQTESTITAREAVRMALGEAKPPARSRSRACRHRDG